MCYIACVNDFPMRLKNKKKKIPLRFLVVIVESVITNTTLVWMASALFANEFVLFESIHFGSFPKNYPTVVWKSTSIVNLIHFLIILAQ